MFFFYSLHSTPAGRTSGIRTGGGTQSAPTGCSPRDYGGLRAVDHSLSTYCLCCSSFFFTEIATPPLRLQKSCDLGTRLADLEKQQIQMNLDLELAKTELQKAKDGANGKTSLSTDLS